MGVDERHYRFDWRSSSAPKKADAAFNYLVRSAQLTVLAFELFDPSTLQCRHARAGPAVDLSSANPQPHRLRRRPQLLRDRADRLPLRPVQALIVQHHPPPHAHAARRDISHFLALLHPLKEQSLHETRGDSGWRSKSRFLKSRNPMSAAASGPDQKSHSDSRPAPLRSGPYVLVIFSAAASPTRTWNINQRSQTRIAPQRTWRAAHRSGSQPAGSRETLSRTGSFRRSRSVASQAPDGTAR